MRSPPCPVCACDAAAGARAHAVQAALLVDDLDGALEHGLLEAGLGCTACSDPCQASLQAAAAARREALAARERFRARQARLARRRSERLARRGSPAPAVGPAAAIPGLPPAAAAALARAKRKAAGRGPQ